MATKKKGERVVQGAYISKNAKKYLKENFKKKQHHSPTEFAGCIIEDYIKEDLKKEDS